MFFCILISYNINEIKLKSTSFNHKAIYSGNVLANQCQLQFQMGDSLRSNNTYINIITPKRTPLLTLLYWDCISIKFVSGDKRNKYIYRLLVLWSVIFIIQQLRHILVDNYQCYKNILCRQSLCSNSFNTTTEE